MDPLFVQHMRYKLQKRMSRLNSVPFTVFDMTLRQFWRFFDGHPTYLGVAEELMARFPEIQQDVGRILAGEALHGETEEEAAALGYAVLRRIAEDDAVSTLNLAYSGARSVEERLEVNRQVLLDPFYEYLDEQLDDQRAMLALLMRYKHRSEWFHRDHLYELMSKTPRRAEANLALDLYSFLYDQGIDFTIEPSSITGEVDMIAAQDPSDPVVLDAKIFDGDSRGKRYIQKGFAQIYTYTQQYNEPFGYLVIFKATDRDLSFSLRRSRFTPTVVHNHKTVFLLTIDVFPHEMPVSRRPPLGGVQITEEELIGVADESEIDQAG